MSQGGIPPHFFLELRERMEARVNQFLIAHGNTLAPPDLFAALSGPMIALSLIGGVSHFHINLEQAPAEPDPLPDNPRQQKLDELGITVPPEYLCQLSNCIIKKGKAIYDDRMPDVKWDRDSIEHYWKSQRGQKLNPTNRQAILPEKFMSDRRLNRQIDYWEAQALSGAMKAKSNKRKEPAATPADPVLFQQPIANRLRSREVASSSVVVASSSVSSDAKAPERKRRKR